MKYTLKNNRTGKDIPEFRTDVDIEFCDKELKFEFYCKNSQMYCASNEYNGNIFDGDVCEVFICVNGNRNNYYEIEVAPNGVEYLCDTVYKGFDYDIDEPILDIKPVEKSFLKSSVQIMGSDYLIKFSIPLDKIDSNNIGKVVLNVFRIETEGGEIDKNLLALNPTMSNKFHHPEFFIEIEK